MKGVNLEDCSVYCFFVVINESRKIFKQEISTLKCERGTVFTVSSNIFEKKASYHFRKREKKSEAGSRQTDNPFPNFFFSGHKNCTCPNTAHPRILREKRNKIPLYPPTPKTFLSLSTPPPTPFSRKKLTAAHTKSFFSCLHLIKIGFLLACPLSFPFLIPFFFCLPKVR